MIDITIFNWIQVVKKYSNLPQQARHLCHYLSTFMNAEQNIAWPSQARIVAETGMSKATVNRYLKLLEGEHWIIRESGNSQKTTRYMVDIPNSLRQRLLEDANSLTQRLQQSHTETKVVSHRDTNNTYNNKDNNIYTGAPTLEEVISYVDSLKEKGVTIHLLASEWFHKMDAMDWRYKGKAVKNWKLTYQNWNNNQAIFAKRDAKKLDSDKEQRFTTQYI